jgi:hypothetical protein
LKPPLVLLNSNQIGKRPLRSARGPGQGGIRLLVMVASGGLETL